MVVGWFWVSRAGVDSCPPFWYILDRPAHVAPDLPVSVFGGHAITADGKIYRSAPLVLGRTGRKTSIRVWSEMRQKAVDVEVDAARVPVKLEMLRRGIKIIIYFIKI